VKAMVLAAGLGTRMRPLTLLRAKPALAVMNRPLLHWTLDLLARNGVTDVMINLHHLPWTVMEAVGDGRVFGLRVSYSREPRILGTGGGPRKVRSFFGDEPFILVNGDMVFDFDLRGLVRRHETAGARATLALRPNPDPRRYSAIRTAKGGRVTSLAGLPRPTRGTASLFTGVHVLDPALLQRLPAGPSDTVRDLYAPLVAEGETVLGVRVRGKWFDIGSPSLYLASHRALLAAGFGGARRGRLLHPDAEVHREARVARSVVGPGCVIEAGARVAGSVLWDGVRVGPRAQVRDSILATGTRVREGEKMVGVVVTPRGGGRRHVVKVTA
jgi:NDP-sugar pyrophosphorylase family protein